MMDRLQEIARIIEPTAWAKIDEGNKGLVWRNLHQSSLRKAERILEAQLEYEREAASEAASDALREAEERA